MKNCFDEWLEIRRTLAYRRWRQINRDLRVTHDPRMKVTLPRVRFLEGDDGEGMESGQRP